MRRSIKQSKSAVVRPAARDDILGQYRYYLLEEAFDAAGNFLDAVDGSIASLCRMPDMGAPKRFKNPLLAGLRSWPVKGFEDIRIYYLVKGGVLRVIRVLHGERDVQRILQDDGGGVQ